MKYEIIIKKTSELTAKNIIDVFDVKDQRWAYGISSQKKWFKKNINHDDYHILIYFEKKLLAYANLVIMKALINNMPIESFGIGNVCTCASFSNKGFGRLLMTAINTFLKQQEKTGLLLCKNELVTFYQSNGWKLVECEKIYFNENHLECKAMYYNLSTVFSNCINSFSVNRLF